MIISTIIFDWTVNLSTILAGLGALGGLILYMKNVNKRTERSRVLMMIKFESLAHAVFISANGSGENVRAAYEAKKKELMDEANFRD